MYRNKHPNVVQLLVVQSKHPSFLVQLISLSAPFLPIDPTCSNPPLAFAFLNSTLLFILGSIEGAEDLGARGRGEEVVERSRAGESRACRRRMERVIRGVIEGGREDSTVMLSRRLGTGTARFISIEFLREG
jgi:hypothetical protein